MQSAIKIKNRTFYYFLFYRKRNNIIFARFLKEQYKCYTIVLFSQNIDISIGDSHL